MVAYTHIVNGKVIPFTDEEKAEWDIKMAKLRKLLEGIFDEKPQINKYEVTVSCLSTATFKFPFL